MPAELQSTKPVAPPVSGIPDVPFGVNEMRLNATQWAVSLGILVFLFWSSPALWKRIERFPTGSDYRIPYQLSKDYWLYARRLAGLSAPTRVVLLGDSVIWGEYVLPDGTLSHFLNQQAGVAGEFVNGGVNGLFPLAQSGLVNDFSRSLHGRKVILECNVLWMSSPKADLSDDKAQQFNHSRLVPQFFPRIPSYQAGANGRLSALIENHIEFFSWVGHLQDAYFGQKSVLNWTLEDDGRTPPRYPNVFKNPFAQISLAVPESPTNDPQRGPVSPRHKPWNQGGQGPAHFDWVPAGESLQWRGFQSVVATLRNRGNDVLVLVGPFNEHMIAEDNRAGYQRLRAAMLEWFKDQHVPVIAPGPLPSDLYADASHPLTQGYESLAKTLFADPIFQSWLSK